MTTQIDLLIKNTLIVDGSGNTPFIGDIAVQGDKVFAVGTTPLDASHIIDGTGLVTCPGFIDPHSHADMAILTHPPAENLVMQGITTFIGGNCGMSWAPFKKSAYFEELMTFTGSGMTVNWESFPQWLSTVEKTDIALNYVPFVGHQAIRVSVMGDDFKRLATPEEIEKMKVIVAESMESGAFGLTSFADPGPGEYASRDELVALATVAQQYNGLYMPHTRHIQSQWPSDNPEEYGYGIFHGPIEDVWVGRYRGYLEAIEISQKAGIPLHIVHLATAFRFPQPHPGYLDGAAAQATLEIIDDAGKQGIDVSFDVIPCSSSIAGKMPLIQSFAQWLGESGNEGLVKKLETDEFRKEFHRVYEMGRFKVGMVHTKADPYWMNRFKVLSCNNEKYEEMTIGEIAGAKKVHPVDALVELLVEDPETQWVQFEDDRDMPAAMPIFLTHPLAMPCTDTIYVLPVNTTDASEISIYGMSPIMFGLYPHYIGTFVRDERVLSLEEAIKKATSMPAKRFGIQNRGMLEPGAYADIVVFDLESIRMKGDFMNPAKAPDGIKFTIINGKIVYDGKAHTGALPGRVIRR
ncbi:MAG: amidohydrolase family protein [Deltaproteobacteria bacterium]|nr:amidohydrolase family protein [Deltaproteobacteria bacterium]